MGVATLLLVRYDGGYFEVSDAAAVAAWGRKEGFVQLGSVADVDEATRVATAILAFQKEPTVATTMGIEPTGTGDDPYADYTVGDSITAPDVDGTPTTQRVVSLTVTEDADSEVGFVNELKSSFLVADEAFNRQLKKLLNGSMRGQTQAANPLPTSPVTRADVGDSLSALRGYVNEHLVERPVQALTTSVDGQQSGTPPVFDPATDQELSKSYTDTLTADGSGASDITIRDGGFPTGLKSAIVQIGDDAGGTPYFCQTDIDGCSNTTVRVLVFDATGAAYPAGAMRFVLHATGW